MKFGLAGVNYTTAKIEEREKIVIPSEKLYETYSSLMNNELISECVILSTCNRTELYAIVNENNEDVVLEAFKKLFNFSSINENVIYQKQEKEAIKHLCNVASGLDSMVLGEPQITGQVKDAYLKAKECGTARYMMNHIFSQINSCVKKVRSKTAIGEKNISVSYAAVKLAQKIIGELANKKVMILGAGDTGELTVRNLKSAGCSDVIVANRTFVKAIELSKRFNGLPIMMHEIVDYIHKIDILISSISVSNYKITYEDVKRARNNNSQKPLLVVDISVPRSIDPDISKNQNVFLCNIDDLKTVTRGNEELRKKEAEKGRLIIEQHLQSMTLGLELYNLIPTLASIRLKAEEIRKDCIEKKISSLYKNGSELEFIDGLTKSIVNKILFHSEAKIKEYSFSLKKK